VAAPSAPIADRHGRSGSERGLPRSTPARGAPVTPPGTLLSLVRRSRRSRRSIICSRLPLDSYGGHRESGRSDGRSWSSPSPAVPGSSRGPKEDPLETTFPIFNRKLGVCGCCIASFCTFSTPVDDAVHNQVFLPANRWSLSSTQPAVQHPSETEEPLFPGFAYRKGCGKTSSASLQ
jgi:hypothetical protein